MDKGAIHAHCSQLLEEKITGLQSRIEDAQQAASEDTKSSAGDKFETSREMIKQEINKLSQQARLNTDMLRSMQQLSPDKSSSQVEFGSLAKTSEGIYYFAVSLGKVDWEGQSLFVLSMASPLGQALMHKKAGDSIDFRGREIKILEVF